MGFSIDLPLPPSVNQAYRNVAGRGRVSTKRLKAWKTEAGWQLNIAHLPHVPWGKPSGYSLAIALPLAMRGDITNKIKNLEDLLVAHELTPDDSHAVKVTVERSADVAIGRCVVRVEEMA